MGVSQHHIGDGSHLGTSARCTSWVIREVQDEPLCAWRNRSIQIISPKFEMIVLGARHGNRRRFSEKCYISIRNPTGRGNHNFIAWVARRKKRVEDDLLASVGDQDLIKRVVQIVLALELALNGFPQ